MHHNSVTRKVIPRFSPLGTVVMSQVMTEVAVYRTLASATGAGSKDPSPAQALVAVCHNLFRWASVNMLVNVRKR